MLNWIRWLLLVLFVAAGLYLLTWAFQSALFSVPAQPWMAEVYKTQAMLLLPISILFVAVGVLFFIALRQQKPGAAASEPR